MKTDTTLPVDSISQHPVLDQIPGIWEDTSAEMLRLAEDVSLYGVHEPLIVVESAEGFLLVDGRHRLRAAQLAGLHEVPVVIRSEVDALDIILATLVHRRHYLKGALAYLSYPIVAEKLREASTVRQKAGLKRGNPVTDGIGDGKINHLREFSLDSIAQGLGLSSDTLLQARQVHDMFRRSPSLRHEFEPRILSGEIGLGACLAGLRSKEATEGGSRKAPTYLTFDGKGNLGGLLPKSLVTISNGFEAWGDLDPEARALFRQQFVELIDKAPAELLSGLKGTRK